MAWEEVLLNIIKATGQQPQSQPAMFLGHLADIVSRLSTDFYRFAAKYTITNFAHTENNGQSESVSSGISINFT